MEPGQFKYIVCPLCIKQQGLHADVSEYPGMILTYGLSPKLVPRLMATCKLHDVTVVGAEVKQELFDGLERAESHELDAGDSEEEEEGSHQATVRETSNQPKSPTIERVSEGGTLLRLAKPDDVH